MAHRCSDQFIDVISSSLCFTSVMKSFCLMISGFGFIHHHQSLTHSHCVTITQPHSQLSDQHEEVNPAENVFVIKWMTVRWNASGCRCILWYFWVLSLHGNTRTSSPPPVPFPPAVFHNHLYLVVSHWEFPSLKSSWPVFQTNFEIAKRGTSLEYP